MTLDLLAASGKLGLYLGVLIGAGTALALASLGQRLGALEGQARRQIRWGVALAMGSPVAGIVLLVLRLGDGFDVEVLRAVLHAPTGLAAGLQVVGAGLLLALAGGGRRAPLVACATVLLASFAVTGHAASASLGFGVVAATHVGAAAWWLGALLLVRSASRALVGAELAALLERFSRHALAVVGAMLVSGLVVVFTLVSPSFDAWLTAYARTLALKIGLAGGALGLAAYNRLRLVPRLARGDPGAARALGRFVTAEIAVLVSVLAVTAWLTTFHSPHESE